MRHKNVIILTHGWTGSSVFSALLWRAGYWPGAATVRKVDYDTFENAELVDINKRLLGQLAPGLNHQHVFRHEDVASIEHAGADADLSLCADFVQRCSSNGAWVWKDPRLTWTIRVWRRVLRMEDTAFLILARNDLQAWISSNKRRHIQSMAFTRHYNSSIIRSNLDFVAESGRPAMSLEFEDLLLRPEATLHRLNSFLGVGLLMSDLQAVHHGPLYRRNRGLVDFFEAALIYLKNYAERDGRGGFGSSPA
jgi:hypothetical protein